MTTVRSPLRLPICGGGSDICTHWRRDGGFLLAATIDKYLTVKTQTVEYEWTELQQHPYATAAGFSKSDLIEIQSDVPPGSGLGSSSALMVALLRAKHPTLPPHELAMAAYDLERYHLGHPVGYQDGFAAAFGGCIALEIDTAGRVLTWTVDLPADFRDRLVLMATGIQRSAADVLQKQARDISTKLVCREAMEEIANLGRAIYDDIRYNKGKRYGELTDSHWQVKKVTTDVITNPVIDAWYDLARKSGASGGKCIGAGGGGYMLFVIDPSDRERFIGVMEAAGMKYTPFQFVDHGVEVIK